MKRRSILTVVFGQCRLAGSWRSWVVANERSRFAYGSLVWSFGLLPAASVASSKVSRSYLPDSRGCSSCVDARRWSQTLASANFVRSRPWCCALADNDRAFTQQLQPRVIALADHFLPVTHGIDRHTHPERAQHILGDVGWMIEPHVNHRKPTFEELDDLIDRLTHPLGTRTEEAA